MARACSICSHSARRLIDAAVVAGTPNRRIASQHGVTEIAVRRHHKHVAAKLAEVRGADARSLAGLVTTYHAHVDDVLDRAKGAGDDELRLKAVKEGRELVALEFGTRTSAKIETEATDLASISDEALDAIVTILSTEKAKAKT